MPGGLLQKIIPKNFEKFTGRVPLISKISDLGMQLSLKRRSPCQVVSCECCEICISCSIVKTAFAVADFKQLMIQN